MESLTVETGLSQGFVTSMIQDHKGFIWLGTYDGLNRYDGYTVRHFKPNPFDSLSIRSSFITFLYEDPQYFIWVGTTEGLFLMDPLKERFYWLSGPNSPLTPHYIESITGDKEGNVLVKVLLEQDPIGIFRLKLPADLSKRLARDANPLAHIPIVRVNVEPPINGRFYLANNVGDSLILGRNASDHFFKYHAASNTFKPFELNTLPAGKGIDHQILWSKQHSQVYRQFAASGADTVLPRDHWAMALRLRDGGVGIWFYPNGPLVAAKTNDPIRLDLLQPVKSLQQQPAFQTDFTTILDGPPTQPDGAKCNWNNRILIDKSGIIWLGTGGWGARKINPQQISFAKFLVGKSISSLRELPNGLLWVRLFNDESFVFNPATGQTEQAPWSAAFPQRTWFYEFFAAKNNRYWFVRTRNYDKRLVLYEAESNKVTHFDAQLPALDGVVEKILEDRAGNIWISGHRGILYRCRPGQYNLDAFSYSNLITVDDQNILRTTAVAQDQAGTIWIGTNKGLLRVDDSNGANPRFTLLQHDFNNRASISINWITSICPDPQKPNLLWIGTRGGGLNRLDIAAQSFSFWTEAANGLPNNVVYGILPDQKGNLWCSTNRGLCRFSPNHNTFTTYLESDGLLSTEFNTNSYLKTRDGRLWFGGVSGLNAFWPETIKSQKQTPPVAITDIKVRGVLRLPDEEGFLSLEYAENNILFEFAALDFANPATNRFRHRLKGLERDWVYDGTSHSANYAALPPGRYQFELQGATADSPWSEKTVVFTLIIHPPWYRSNLAYFLYLLLAISIMYGFVRYREHLFTLENSARLNQLESERLKAFERVKNQFFVNIAHELRTPLTVIMGLANRIRKGIPSAETPENARQIIKQSEQLLALTNQVLDLAKLESALLQLHPEKGNFMAFIRDHTQALTALAASKGIRMQVITPEQDLWLAFDRQQWQKILNNLVSNAIRHTASGGLIVVKAQHLGEDKVLNITVSDTGEGIPAEDLPRVFDRFFQSSNPGSKTGASGIGLTLTRDLVQLMSGQISVQSQPGEGAVFLINLPVERLEPDGIAPVTTLVDTPVTTLPAGSSNKPLLLVIEDNPDVWGYLRLCLQANFRLEHAMNGLQGIEKAFELIPDIILTDVAMPLKNGYEVTSTLKADERTSHIPIAILTAKTDASERMEGHRRGANAYLSKPFDESELLLVLHNLLHLQEQWKTRYAYSTHTLPATADTDLPMEEVQQEDQFMQKVYAIFETNFANDAFNLESLCRMLNMSSSQLDRKIKALTNQSPMQMLRSYRLQKAQALLRKEPGITIKEVCFRTGFKSPAHFSRLYSKEFGAPPSAG